MLGWSAAWHDALDIPVSYRRWVSGDSRKFISVRKCLELGTEVRKYITTQTKIWDRSWKFEGFQKGISFSRGEKQRSTFMLVSLLRVWMGSETTLQLTLFITGVGNHSIFSSEEKDPDGDFLQVYWLKWRDRQHYGWSHPCCWNESEMVDVLVIYVLGKMAMDISQVQQVYGIYNTLAPMVCFPFSYEVAKG